MKKLLSLLLVLTFLLSVMSVVSYAETTVYESVSSSDSKLPFEDINPNSWYIDGLTYCYANNIISGAGNTYTFNPKGKLTRATFAVMLARATGADCSQYTSQTFSDCNYSTKSWYAKSVEWAAHFGYMNGTGGNEFSPNDTMTREQLATVFMRYMQLAGYSVTVSDNVLDGYTDTKDISSWALKGVKYAIAAGLISSTSTSEKVFSPKMAVTRDQAVKLFKSFLTVYFYGKCQHNFTSATCTEGSVCSLCGMVNSLPNGHRCASLSCNVGGTCLICGTYVEPDAGLHIYSDATCTTPETCSVCGGTREAALGHKYKAATCTTPKTCTRCGVTSGEPSDHKYKNGVCTYCKDCPFDNLAAYLKKDGGAYYETTYASEKYSFSAVYGDSSKVLYFALNHTYSHGHYDFIQFDVNRTGTKANFKYQYFDADGNLLFDGYGSFTPADFSSTANISFTKYSGNVADLNTALSNVKVLGDTLISVMGKMTGEWYQINIFDLGFKKY